MALPTPPAPDTSALLRLTQEHRQALIAQDAGTMVNMADRWLQLENSLEAQIGLLSREITDMQAAGEAVGINRVLKLRRYRTLLGQFDTEMERYNKWAGGEIADQQLRLAQMGLTHAVEATQLSLTEAGYGVGRFFDRVPVRAIENMIGMTGSGAPLRNLLNEAAPLSVEHMTRALIEGLAMGLPPGQTARLMMDGMAMGLTRTTLIARSEQLRVYRESGRQQYDISEAIQTYERVCANQPDTCMACIALDGKIYPTNEVMEVHPADRCFMIPHVAGADPIERERGKDWFAKQSPELQKQMMGPGRFELYNSGQISLQDLVTQTDHPVWGRSLEVTTLKNLERAQALQLRAPVGGPYEEFAAQTRHIEDFRTLNPALSESVEASGYIYRAEEKSVKLDVEVATVVDEQGNFLFKRGGVNVSSVNLSGADIQRMERSRVPIIMTHNHPGGTSFSKEDVIFGYTVENVNTIRAATTTHIYEMQILTHGDIDRFGQATGAFFDEVEQRTEDFLVPRVVSDELTLGEAKQLQAHWQWQEFAEVQDNFTYSVYGPEFPSMEDITNGDYKGLRD